MLSRRALLASAAAAAPCLSSRARAQSGPIRSEVLIDLSGIYQDNSGKRSVACAQQAVEEFATGTGLNAELVSADHQNNADINASIVRAWFDRGAVDVVMDVPNSAVVMAVSAIAREKDKVFIASQTATTVLTGEQCSPSTLQWTYDTCMLSRSNGGAMARLWFPRLQQWSRRPAARC